MFRNWDFERSVLAFMGLLIIVGVGFIVWQRAVYANLESHLKTSENQLAQMGDAANEILALQEEMNGDLIANGKVGAYGYIEQQEVESRIGKKFNIATPTKDPHPSEAYEDERYVLTTALPDYDFSRQEIANFLLRIEGNTTRMKTTRIRLDLSTRKNAGSDAWKPTFTITDRRPLQPSGG